MPRKPRDLQPGYCYHITVRCNSRKFYLIRHELKDLLLSILKDYQAKYGFKLYGLSFFVKPEHQLGILSGKRLEIPQWLISVHPVLACPTIANS